MGFEDKIIAWGGHGSLHLLLWLVDIRTHVEGLSRTVNDDKKYRFVWLDQDLRHLTNLRSHRSNQRGC